MKALLSDIHSNLEALQAVLADADRHGVEAIYCLGDVVGYGPNPRECLDLVMQRCPVALLGNHDQAMLFEPDNFKATAEQAANWTRNQLEATKPCLRARERRWNFLAQCPTRHREGELLFVHGSPRRPVEEYIRPEDVYDEPKVRALFARVGRCCFHGHTHMPGVLTESLDFHRPEEIDFVYRLDGHKVLVNVGSVGQPRDRDWRACYALLDGDVIRFRRVEYDVETTVGKIREAEGLDNSLGKRLRKGR